MADPFYITTAIHYPNGRPHIGHAYEMIAADAIARFQRQARRDVLFQTGTDEHGLKMAQAARERGIPVRDFADEMSSHFSVMADRLGISYDRFIRTVDDDHYAASKAIWQAMADAGDLYLDRYEGWYSVRDEAFYDEAELTTPPTRTSSAPTAAATRSCASSRAACRTCRYRGPVSTGACRCLGAPGT